MSQYFPSPNDVLGYARRQIQLNPRKYGYVGSYSRELMEVAVDPTIAYDQIMVRFTTTVLTGRTISAAPRVEMKYPASWWQHFKHWADWWQSDRRAAGGHWLFLVVPLLALIVRYIRKHPVRYSTLKADVPFSQDILYPEMDFPAQCGRPVILEEVSMLPSWEPQAEQWGASLARDPSRFMSRYEIRREVLCDQDLHRYPRDYPGNEAEATLEWLNRNGVNVDQLVKRR